MKILLSWIGRIDLTCAEKNDANNIGPIAQALHNGHYDKIFLFSNYQEPVESFLNWIRTFTSTPINVEQVTLSSPTNHSEIYSFIRTRTHDIQSRNPDARLTFHISPGTSAMALTWMLLAPIFGAEIIESSKEQGVSTVNLPFEIAAYFLPDKEITRLSEHKTPKHPAFDKIIHTSPIMSEAVARAQTVARRDVTVLLEGESGTGKELFAKAIHYSSSRAANPFKIINCGAIPSELIESILFGHEKGAFTHAIQATKGVFEEAHTGTLFLDELGELPLKAQVALLRVLQEKRVTKIGGSKAIPVDVRIIAATNRKLIEEVAKGNFRSDLFYRIAVGCIHIPPLRERGEDLALLLDNAIMRANEELSNHGRDKHKQFSSSAKKIILQHSWPGNVRELYNTVIRAMLWTHGDIIQAEHAQEALFQTNQDSTSLLDYPVGNGFSIKELIGNIAAHYIERAEKESAGNKTKASKLLGFENYQTYTNWQKKYTRSHE